MDNIKIIIDTNAEQASKSFDDLSQSFNKADTAAVDLRKQIKELKNDLYKLEPGTEEYANVLQDLGAKMNQLSDTQQELRVATGGLDTVFQTTTQATATMAAGFSAATGVVALFGGDTENLQKTFVKLQAVMAIATGLKGFAAFEKMTKRASISLKAYIAQMKLARTATQQQSAANVTLSTTTTVASTATKGLGAAIKSVTAAIASNPIGAVLVALTAAVTAITSFNSRAKEAEERARKLNDTLNELKKSTYTYTSLLDQELDYFNKDIAAMKALGASQESINKKTLEFSEARRAQLKQDRDYLLHLIEVNGQTEGLEEQTEKWTERVRELNTEISGLDKTIAELSYTLPSFASSFDSAFSDLERDLGRKVARGAMTERQAITREIDYIQDEINRLEKAVTDADNALRGTTGEMDENGRYIKSETKLTTNERRQMEQDKLEMESRLDQYRTMRDQYLQKREDIDDRTAKTLSDKRQARFKESKDELNKLEEEIKKEYEKAEKEIASIMDAGKLMSEALDSDSEARMYESIQNIGINFENLVQNLINTAKENNKLLPNEYESFVKTLALYQSKLDGIFAEKKIDYKDWPFEITSLARNLDAASDLFVKENNIMLEQVRIGTLKIDEYNEWLLSRTAYYNDERNKLMMEGYNLIDSLLAGMDVSEEQKEEYRSKWSELFDFSGTLLPPEESKKIENALKTVIDNAFNQLEDNYKARMSMFEKWAEDQSRTWLDGGMDTSYWGDSPTAAYKKSIEQADGLYKLLHEQYTAEAKLLEEKMKLLDVNSEAYAQYYTKLQELRQADADAQHAQETASLAAHREYAQNIMEMAGQFGDAVSGLAGAMGSYYAEQAEQAKEMYGENSEEYKKFLKKEGNMKIAQVWTDAATGIMTAWATSEQLGPIAGPIMAAIQTAALLATAVASTQQIKRQTKANASGGSTDANVSGITDRVVFGEAQNASQQAQLNAEYNQGAARVFVVEGDINNAQGNTRTAVTNNTF